MSRVQHVIESNHYTSQRFCSGGETIIYLINNICSTLWKIIEFEDLRFLDLLLSLVQLCLGLAVDKIQRFFLRFDFVCTVCEEINKSFLSFSKWLLLLNTSRYQILPQYSACNSYVFLKKPVSDFSTSSQTIHGNVSSIKSNSLFYSNNKIFDVARSWTYIKWSITSSWFSCLWKSFICIRETCIV